MSLKSIAIRKLKSPKGNSRFNRWRSVKIAIRATNAYFRPRIVLSGNDSLLRRVRVVSVQASKIDREIGARIRMRRHELGINQRSLAEHLGMSFQQVQKYEVGTSRISAATLVQIASFLKCTATALIDGDHRASEPAVSTDVHALLKAQSKIKSPELRKLLIKIAKDLGEQSELESRAKAAKRATARGRRG